MITIIGAYPNKKNEKDGMVQRISAIDNLLKEKKRIYLDISMKKYWKVAIEKKRNITIYRINAFIYMWLVFMKCYKSDVIYVHSIYNALKILPVYLFHKNIITDMHGVVLEELKMEGKYVQRAIYTPVENIVLEKSKKIIVVTNKMKEYYEKKYIRCKNKMITISIFPQNKMINVGNECNTAIYSGGTQIWQCIDKMIKLINKTNKETEWTILSSDTKNFKKKIKGRAIIKSVNPENVYDYYKKNTYGVVLRKDDIVNQVACPTKLIEYIQNGLIPVVDCTNIGDFEQFGYRYIIYNDFYQGVLPSADEIVYMRNKNFKVLEKIINMTNENIKILQSIM